MANQFSLSLYDELVSSFDSHVDQSGSSSVAQTRQKGFEHFKKQGFPTRRNEEWKYTNVTPFLQEHYHTNGLAAKAAAGADLSVIDRSNLPQIDAFQLVMVNGHLQETNQLTSLPEGLSVLTIEEAQRQENLAHLFIQNIEEVKKYPFAALNAAFFSNGLFIDVKANAVLEKPLHIIHLFTADSNLFVQPKHLVNIGKNAIATVLETVISERTAARVFVNSFCEINVEENAKFDHYTIQTAQSGTRLVNHTEVRQKRYSTYSNFTFCLPGSELIRNNLHVSLDESETESHLYGLYLGAGNQLIDNHSLVNHKMPRCNSNEVYKGVLTENSTGVFNGKIFVQPDAQKTNAFQQNNNLLLSDKATINSKPQLEIFADDVKCSHGSTVGQLSREAMFYLQSRGIGKLKAKALLVNAFLFDVTEKIKIPELEQYINDLIAQHIPSGEQVMKDVE